MLALNTHIAFIVPCPPRLAPKRYARHTDPHRSPVPITMRAFWVQPTSKPALTTALEADLRHLLFASHHDHKPYQTLASYHPIVLQPDGTFDDGIYATIQSADDVETLASQAGAYATVLIDCPDWAAIPAENLIAAYHRTRTRLFAIVHDAPQAAAMFSMLQAGVHGCVLRTADPQHVLQFASLRRRLEQQDHPISLQSAQVISVRPVGTGERVCVDTCSLLRPDEGMLVGSSSKALFLVLSEAAEVSYVPTRPFRINAGPVHSYCLAPDGKTRYLSELAAGDEVLIVGPQGREPRSAVVGRAKIETRPLILLEARSDDGNLCTLFVQNAETVRLVVLTETGDVDLRSVTKLQPDDRLVLRTDTVARHTGIAIEEDLLEK